MTPHACQALIAGAGPAGLASALMLRQRGWRDIVVLEQQPSPAAFERGRAFNYQLDGRGQQILEAVGFDGDTLRRYGLPNDRFTQVIVAADGSARRLSFPALLPGRKTPYWMTRARLLEMLRERLAAVDTDGAVTLMHDQAVTGLRRDEGGALVVESRAGDGTGRRFRPRLILACDGLKSAVRQSLQQLAPDGAARFAMTRRPSPSAELAYKVLRLPPTFGVCGGDLAVDDHTLAYCFLSRYREQNRRMALFALPVPHATEPRNINIILHRNHAFWQLESGADVRRWLDDAFPQLDFERLLAPGELDDVAALPLACFPAPQYSNGVHFSAAAEAGTADVLLLGDAARAFPPDLGMGVNAALEDVFILGECLGARDGDISGACADVEARRLPENRALVGLVRRVHPYQYNQVPWRLKLWFLKFLCQRRLHRLSGGRVPLPGFVLSQKHLLDFVTMDRQTRQADRAFYACVALVLGVPLLLILLAR